MSNPLFSWFGYRYAPTGVRSGQRFRGEVTFEAGDTSGIVTFLGPGKVPQGALLTASIEYGTYAQIIGVVCQRTTNGSFVVVLNVPSGASAVTIPVNAKIEF